MSSLRHWSACRLFGAVSRPRHTVSAPPGAVCLASSNSRIAKQRDVYISTISDAGKGAGATGDGRRGTEDRTYQFGSEG